MKPLWSFSYRAFNIHLGALFGTNMAFNVWFRIWPNAQQSIITAIKNGHPDGDLVALAWIEGLLIMFYMSVPLIWTMMNQHTCFCWGEFWHNRFYKLAGAAYYHSSRLAHCFWQLYKKSGTIKGF